MFGGIWGRDDYDRFVGVYERGVGFICSIFIFLSPYLRSPSLSIPPPYSINANSFISFMPCMHIPLSNSMSFQRRRLSSKGAG